MLRASIEVEGSGGELHGIAEGAKAGDAGIPHGALLAAFAEAAVRGDGAALVSARDALRAAAGSPVVVDAAAVIGNFERMVRIADGTGIPIDGIVDVLSSGFRKQLGLEGFASRRRTRGPLRDALAPFARGAARLGLRLAGRVRRAARARPG